MALAPAALAPAELKVLLRRIVEEQGLVTHHTNDYDNLTDLLGTIVTKQFGINLRFPNPRATTEEGAKIKTIAVSVSFEDMRMHKPTTTDRRSTSTIPMMPVMCRNHNCTYAAGMSTTIRAVFTAYDHQDRPLRTLEQVVPNHKIATVPVMVRSRICNTSVAGGPTPPAMLRIYLEDPTDHGGYVIVGGEEYYIMSGENVVFNKFHFYLANPASAEVAWAEIISQPGDTFENSHQMHVRLSRKKSLCVEVAFLPMLQIPFYVLFRLLGLTVDREIVETVVAPGPGDAIASMLQAAYESDDVAPELQAIRAEYDQVRIARHLGCLVRKMDPAGKYDADVEQMLCSDVMARIDRTVVPHVGTTPADRVAKAHYLGYSIFQLLRVGLGIIPPTDRDSYANKRIHAAGAALAKTFKNQFNLTVVLPLSRYIKEMFERGDFSNASLPAAVAKIRLDALETGLAKIITTSADTITIAPTVRVPRRLSTQLAQRKNPLNVLCTARTIDVPAVASRSSSRAENMRLVYSNHLGYICPSASKDTGEKVGLSKEMAVTAVITPIQKGASYILYERVAGDALVRPAGPREIAAGRMTRVFVNGRPAGATAQPHQLCVKYRALRRAQRRPEAINRYTSIRWNPQSDEIHFNVEFGQLTRPLLIVENNLEDVLQAEEAIAAAAKGGGAGGVGAAPPHNGGVGGAAPAPPTAFRQAPVLTRAMLAEIASGARTFESLVMDGVMEYISCEEQLDCFLADSVDTLARHAADPTHAFTHVDIPEAMFGLAALMSPLANFNAGTRVTYETNQVKQTCCYYSRGWPWRTDKNVAYQANCEYPLTPTFTNSCIGPIGFTVTGSFYAPMDGDNQEDSVIMNRGPIDLGLMWLAYFRYFYSPLEAGDLVRIPRPDDTADVRTAASYSKLSPSGIVAPGTVVNNNDVIIAKLATMPPTPANERSGAGKYSKYVDRSIVYPYAEPAVVDPLTRTETMLGANGRRFVAVKTVSSRYIEPGDKLSTRVGNKSIVAKVLNPDDVPVMASGAPVTCIINPHTVVTRMVVAQILEGVVNKLAAQSGICMELSSFTALDMDAVRAELTAYGLHNVCLEQAYDGRTGEAIDALIVLCPQMVQRLQKFSVDELRSSQAGGVDQITRQPVRAPRTGGMRFGEMEKDALTAHGSMACLANTIYTNSDGTDIYVCRRCSRRAIVGIQRQVFICTTCGPHANIVRVPSAFVTNVFLSELAAMNIDTKLHITPQTFT